MRIKKINIVILFAFLFTGACNPYADLDNPLDGFKLIIDYDIFETFITLRFIDSHTGELIGAIDETSVKVSVSGEHAEAVVNQLGEHKQQYLSFSGLLFLALNPKPPFVPEENNPLSFKITSSYEGYVAQEFKVTIDQAGKYSYDIYLEKDQPDALTYTYYRSLSLDENGILDDSINIVSFDKEISFSLPEGAEFLDSTGNKIIGNQLNILIKYFKDPNLAPVPLELITDVSINSQNGLYAYNPVSLAEIRIWTEDIEATQVINRNVDLKFKLPSSIRNPENWQNFQQGDSITSWYYNKGHQVWEDISNYAVYEEDESLYYKMSTNHLFVNGPGILQQTCRLNGVIDLSFPIGTGELPVNLGLDFFRMEDGKYLGTITYEIDESDTELVYNKLVPEGDQVQMFLKNLNQESFYETVPTEFTILSPCGQVQDLTMELIPSSMFFEGTIQFNLAEDFPDEPVDIYINYYNNENGALILRKQFTVNDGVPIDISTNLLMVNSILIGFEPVKNENDFVSSPSEIIVNDPQSGNHIYIVELNPQNCERQGTIDFQFEGLFGGDLIDFILEIEDTNNGEILYENIYQCSEISRTVPISFILPKSREVKIKIFRTENGTDFHAVPYEYYLGNSCGGDFNWVIELTPVEFMLVNVGVTINCPSVQIIPSFKGYYRLIWEEQWNEVNLEYGHAELEMEINGIYELGILIDNEMISREYVISEQELELIFDLDDEDCNKLGY